MNITPFRDLDLAAISEIRRGWLEEEEWLCWHSVVEFFGVFCKVSANCDDFSACAEEVSHDGWTQSLARSYGCVDHEFRNLPSSSSHSKDLPR